LRVSDRCHYFCHEIENYVTDENGNLPEGGDHLLDCKRYILRHINYKFVERVEQQRAHLEARGITDINAPREIELAQNWDDEVLFQSVNADPWDTSYN
jgi:hypothetical protein